MKKHFSLRSLIIVFLSVLCIGLGFLNLLKAVSVSTNAQELCPYMTYGTNEFVSFPRGEAVRVYFDNSVSIEDRAIWTRVFNAWSNLPGAQVRFFTETTTGSLPYSLTVRTGTTGFTDPTYRGQVLDRTTDSNGYLKSAVLQIHPNVTNALARELTMSHETGHTLGAGHPVGNITSSRTATSNRASSDFNDTSTGSIAPTDCDRDILPTIYQNGGTKYSDGGGGGGAGSGYYTQSYCSSQYLVTDYYISYDGGQTWQYWYSTYEYMGDSCMLYM